MVKKSLSIKLEASEIDELRNKAMEERVTVTDLIISGLRDRKTEDHLRKKNENLEQQMQDLNKTHETRIEELEQKFKALTGKRPDMVKRVSFSVSAEQFKALNIEAARRGIAKSELLRDTVFPEKTTERKALV